MDQGTVDWDEWQLIPAAVNYLQRTSDLQNGLRQTSTWQATARLASDVGGCGLNY